MSPDVPEPVVKNQTRRTLLLAGLTGVGAFVASKVLSGLSLSLRTNEESIVSRAEFEHFVFEETSNEMTLREKGGEVIFIVDKASFKQ